MRNWVGKAMFLLLCGTMIMAEVSITCTCRQHEYKTFCSTVLHKKACEDHRWKVNGEVVAHPQNSNQDLVKEYGPENITFKAVQTKVQYSCDSDTFSCEDVIPTQPSSQGMKNHDSTGHGVTANHIIIIVVVVIIIIIIIIIATITIAVCCWKRRRQERYRNYNPTNPTENLSSC